MANQKRTQSTHHVLHPVHQADKEIIMRLSILIALLVTVPLSARAQEPTQVKPRTTVGFELDALPYISGGYYASAWIGRDRIRVRPVITKTSLPSFVVQDGFENADLQVYAAIVDYFFRDGFRGPWIGTGVEYWQNSIENEINGGTAEWNNTIATIGGGYVWKFAGNFYLNPWGAGHLVVGGPTSVDAGGASYSPKRFTPEVSIKLGWHF